MRLKENLEIISSRLSKIESKSNLYLDKFSLLLFSTSLILFLLNKSSSFGHNSVLYILTNILIKNWKFCFLSHIFIESLYKIFFFHTLFVHSRLHQIIHFFGYIHFSLF